MVRHYGPGLGVGFCFSPRRQVSTTGVHAFQRNSFVYGVLSGFETSLIFKGIFLLASEGY